MVCLMKFTPWNDQNVQVPPDNFPSLTFRSMLSMKHKGRLSMKHKSRLLLLGTGILLLMTLGLILIDISSHPPADTHIKDSNFYYDFNNSNAPPKVSRTHRHKTEEIFVNRKRVFNNSRIVYIEDILFVPEKPLPKGFNLYKIKKDPESSNREPPVYEEELSKFNLQSNRMFRNKVPPGSFFQSKRNRLKYQNRDFGLFSKSRYHNRSLPQLRESQRNDRSLPQLREPQRNDRSLPQLREPQRNDRSLPQLREPQRNDRSLPQLREPQRNDRSLPQLRVREPQKNVTCIRALCKEFLSQLDTPHFKYCLKKSGLSSIYEPFATACQFQHANSNSPSVALASSPGSGADHVRRLLQEVTGICTGSINCDVTLRRSGYPGECLRSRTVLVVKTHQIIPFWHGMNYNLSEIPRGFSKMVDVPVFESAIYLLRNPYEATMEEWKGNNYNPGNYKVIMHYTYGTPYDH